MKSFIRPVLILLAIFFFHCCVNFQIIRHDNGARLFDEKGRIVGGLNIFERFFLPATGCIPSVATSLFKLDNGQGHPRLYEFIEAVVFKTLVMTGHGSVGAMILGTNAIFLLILLISVMGIGSKLYDVKTGLLAAFIVGMFPLVAGFSRVAMIDFPLMSMVSLSFYLLLRTNSFTSLFASVLCGAGFGLAQLTKESAVIFILPVLLYYFCSTLALSDRRKTVINFLVTILSFIVVAGASYGRADSFHVYSRYWGVLGINNHSLVSNYFHALVIIMGPCLLLGVVLAFFVLILNFKKEDFFIFIWFVAPFVIFSLSSNKAPRFILPLAPSIALILAAGVMRIDTARFFRLAAVILVGFLAMAQFTAYYFGYLDNFGWGISTPPVFMERGVWLPRSGGIFFTAASKLCSIFEAESERDRKPAIVLFMFDEPEINSMMEIKMRLAHLPIATYNPFQGDQIAIRQCVLIKDPDKMLEYNYILERTNYIENDLTPFTIHLRVALSETFVKHRHCFEKIAEVVVGENSTINVYKRTY